jgi:hypothetical protein
MQVNIISCEEAIAQNLSPGTVRSIARFHQQEINAAIKAKQSPSEYNIKAIPLILELARQMVLKLREQGVETLYRRHYKQNKPREDEYGNRRR